MAKQGATYMQEEGMPGRLIPPDGRVEPLLRHKQRLREFIAFVIKHGLDYLSRRTKGRCVKSQPFSLTPTLSRWAREKRRPR